SVEHNEQGDDPGTSGQGNPGGGAGGGTLTETTVKVKVQKLTSAQGSYSATTAYVSATTVEVTVPVLRTDGTFLAKAKEALAKEVAKKDGHPKYHDKYKFFQDGTTGGDIQPSDLVADESKTIYVGRLAFTVHAKVTIGLITGTNDLTSSSTWKHKIGAPASSAPFNGTVNKEHTAATAEFYADDEVTKDAVKKVIEKVVTDNSATITIGDNANNYRFFKDQAPAGAAKPYAKDLNDLPDDIQGKTIYIGKVTS
ncbi:MAG: hypothetical protein ACTTJ7_06205, partial [Treponema sp.]